MSTKNINLKNDKVLTIRKASPYDAKYIVEYLNIVDGESDNLLFGKDEFHLSEQDEAKYIHISSISRFGCVKICLNM